MVYLHFLGVQNLESILKKVDLSFVIGWRICCHGRTGIDLNKPGAQLVVKQDVETIEFEAMLVVNDGLCDGLERANDAVLDKSGCL